MSLRILAVNQTITVLETKQISMSLSCLCTMISCRQNLCLQAMFNEKCQIHKKFNINAECIPQKWWFYLLGLELPISFIQKSIIKYLFNPVDFFYTLLKICDSLNHQQLWLFQTTLNWMIIFNFLTYLYLILGSVFIFPIIMLTNLYNCTWFSLFWNFALFILHFILHIKFFLVLLFLLFFCFIGKRLINFYSQKWNTWWWNNCEMKELGTT